MSPWNSSLISRSAVPAGTFVRLIVAMSCVWAITRCGRRECSGVSTLGAGPSPSMQPAMNRIIWPSLIASAWRRGARRASDRRVNPSGPMVRRSVLLPLTNSASTMPPESSGSVSLIEVLPPPG